VRGSGLIVDPFEILGVLDFVLVKKWKLGFLVGLPFTLAPGDLLLTFLHEIKNTHRQNLWLRLN